jgi:hypothetical protein
LLVYGTRIWAPGVRMRKVGRGMEMCPSAFSTNTYGLKCLREKPTLYLVLEDRRNPGLRPGQLSAVPSGLNVVPIPYPGLRPGLLSAVPSGLHLVPQTIQPLLARLVLTQTLKPVACLAVQWTVLVFKNYYKGLLVATYNCHARNVSSFQLRRLPHRRHVLPDALVSSLCPR